MVREAEAHADDDAKRREEIEERNRADSLAYQAEKIVRESGDKLPADLKTEVEEKTKALQDALKANDMPKVRESQTALAGRAEPGRPGRLHGGAGRGRSEAEARRQERTVGRARAASRAAARARARSRASTAKSNLRFRSFASRVLRERSAVPAPQHQTNSQHHDEEGHTWPGH